MNISVLDAPQWGTLGGSEFSVGDIVYYRSARIIGVISRVEKAPDYSICYGYFHFNDGTGWDLRRTYNTPGHLLAKIGHIDGVKEELGW